MEPILLIRNSKSGLVQREQEIQNGINYLTQKGFEVIVLTIEDVVSIELFRKRIEQYKPTTLVAVGGDGTVNLLSQYLVNTNLRLSVIPAGTFNHFAKHIGIGTDMDEAFKTIINGETIVIDTAQVNGRVFVNFSCVGFYTQLIKKRIEYQKKAWKKWSAFVISLYENTVKYSLLYLQISRNEADVKISTPLVFIGNNIFEFGGADILSAREDFTSGKLQISIAPQAGRWGIFHLLFKALFGDIKNKIGFTTVALDEIEINSKHINMAVSLDGEIVSLKTPLYYKIQPRSLKVIVPKD